MKYPCRYPASSFLLLLLCRVTFLSSVVFGQCLFCQDGSEPPNPDFVTKDFNLPCGILALRARSISADATDPDICAEYAMLGLMCGCPAPDNACTLCEDKTEVPEKDLSIGQNACEELALEGSLQSSQEWSLCPAWRASYGVYCGCDNRISSEGFCRICGDALLPNPSAVVEINDLGFEITCADIELNENNFPCDEIQSTYSSVCCASVPVNTSDTFEGIEDTSIENTTAIDSNEGVDESEDTSIGNFTVLDSNETLDETEDHFIDDTAVVAFNETLEETEDTSIDNTTVVDFNEFLEETEDSFTENSTVVDSNEILEETEGTSVENATVVDSNETLEDDSTTESDANDVQEDTEDTLPPSSDPIETEEIKPLDEVATLASFAFAGGAHSSLVYAAACGAIFVIIG